MLLVNKIIEKDINLTSVRFKKPPKQKRDTLNGVSRYCFGVFVKGRASNN